MTRNTLISTKAKRETIYSQLAAVMTVCGGSISRGKYDDPHEINIHLGWGDYRANVWLNSKSRGAGFIIHWHTIIPSGARYPWAFVGSHVNEHHFTKATSAADSVDELVDIVRRGFAVLQARAQETVE